MSNAATIQYVINMTSIYIFIYNFSKRRTDFAGLIQGYSSAPHVSPYKPAFTYITPTVYISCCPVVLLRNYARRNSCGLRALFVRRVSHAQLRVVCGWPVSCRLFRMDRFKYIYCLVGRRILHHPAPTLCHHPQICMNETYVVFRFLAAAVNVEGKLKYMYIYTRIYIYIYIQL